LLPAFAGLGGAFTVIVTVSFEGWQTPLLTVQTNLFVPNDKLVTPEFGCEELLIVPPPAITLQLPFPTAGLFAASVYTEAQIVWSFPALACVGCAFTVIFTVSEDEPQALLSVHTN
jgi:hypothetical protein